MKKITFLLLAFTGISAMAQETSYEIRTLTFENSDSKGYVNYNEGLETWSSLIDDAQYGGSLLYPDDYDDEEDDLYGWYDEGNTEIMSTLTNAWFDGKYWGGGIAISNYIDDDLSHGTFEYQLSVPKSNGSSSFAVVFCNANPTINPANPQTSLSFADESRVIESIKISPTTYQLNVAKNGNGFAKALTAEDDYLTITFYGLDDEGEQTGEVSFDLAKGGSFVEDWTEVSLLDLGSVRQVLLTMDSSDKGGYGVNQASYFAIDDIKVRFDNSGSESEATAISSENITVVSIEYFNLAGQKIAKLQKGVNIVKPTYSDGTTKTYKQIVK